MNAFRRVSIWTLLIMIVSFSGCFEEKEWNLEIVLPQGYHGVFKIFEDSKNKITPQRHEGNMLTITVPDDGIVTLKKIKKFDDWHSTIVRYEDGTTITDANFYELDSNALGFYSLWSDDKNNIYYLIGTKKEYQRLQEAGPWEVDKFIPSIKGK